MKRPIAATTQIRAAVVRPAMWPRDWMMVPAPMKPMPVTTWAAIRPGSPLFPRSLPPTKIDTIMM